MTGSSWAEPATGESVRIAVIVTNNVGLEDEEPLQYADAEGERIRSLLVELGGFDEGNIRHVAAASSDELVNALSWAVLQASRVQESGRSSTFFFYYTGHAGADGLHLNGEVMPLTDLKTMARVVPSEKRIFAIDACQSGQFFRSKGARIVEVESRPKNFQPPPEEAWITSSGPEELSFEVDRRRGALFTHYFVSGARGAADLDGDNRVTLAELYAFVSQQTRASAAELGQVQSPRWAGELQDFVIGDLSRLPTGLTIEGPVRHALLVIDLNAEAVVAEMPTGPGGTLAIPAGRYQLVSLKDGGRPSAVEVVVADGVSAPVRPETDLKPVYRVRTKGGVSIDKAWSLGLAYRLGLGESPNRTDVHGASVKVGRLLGRGHGIRFALSFGTVPFSSDYLAGSELRLTGGAQYSHDLLWRKLRLAPGLRIEAGWLRQSAARAAHPIWGDWYGAEDGSARNDFFVMDYLGTLTLGIPLDPRRRFQVVAELGGGAQLVAADRPRVVPIAFFELGFEIGL